MQKLELLNVVQGFNQSEISKALKTKEPSTFEIATGILPKQGKDGWIEVIVDVNSKVGPKEKDDGSVDYREIKTIPNVERGEVITIIHPPIPGQIGYTVTNEPLSAKPTFPVTLKAGNGVMMIKNKVVVTESGRPFIKKRGQLVKIEILPKLTHTGDVDLSSGNISFMGDVEILGEVTERMVVRAEGDIMVAKTINNASIISSGSIITYGNIISSELSAGKNTMIIDKLNHLLSIINKDLVILVSVIRQLQDSPDFKSTDISRVGLQPLL